MELSEKVENVGGSGAAYAGMGGMGLFLMAIFLVVLFSLFWRGRGTGAADGVNLASALGEFHPREGCADKLTWSRYANFVDPEIMRNHIEQAKDTGKIMTQQAIDTGKLECSIKAQTGELLLNQEKTTHAILANQNNIAREQEKMFFNAQIDAKNEKLAEQRERALMLESRLMQSESAREADRRQAELMNVMNGQFCLVNNRITGIEGSMLRQPPFYAFGGVAAVNPCPPCGGYGNSNCNTCG